MKQIFIPLIGLTASRDGHRCLRSEEGRRYRYAQSLYELNDLSGADMGDQR